MLYYYFFFFVIVYLLVILFILLFGEFVFLLLVCLFRRVKLVFLGLYVIIDIIKNGKLKCL